MLRTWTHLGQDSGLGPGPPSKSLVPLFCVTSDVLCFRTPLCVHPSHAPTARGDPAPARPCPPCGIHSAFTACVPDRASRPHPAVVVTSPPPNGIRAWGGNTQPPPPHPLLFTAVGTADRHGPQEDGVPCRTHLGGQGCGGLVGFWAWLDCPPSSREGGAGWWLFGGGGAELVLPLLQMGISFLCTSHPHAPHSRRQDKCNKP